MKTLSVLNLRRRVVTLVYVFDLRRRVLLLKRKMQPNAGLYSPPGGKVELHESPKDCAIRELREETGLVADPAHTALAGVATEIGYDHPDDQWLMFLYRVKKWRGRLKTTSDEGELSFISIKEIMDMPIPHTDRDVLWPRIFTGEFFDIRIDCANKRKLKVIE